MKVLVVAPTMFDAEVVRTLPDGRVLVELAARRVVIGPEDVEPSVDRTCEALAAYVARTPPGPDPTRTLPK